MNALGSSSIIFLKYDCGVSPQEGKFNIKCPLLNFLVFSKKRQCLSKKMSMSMSLSMS